MTQVEPLEYYLEGNSESKNIVVFLQGWPDNHQVWEPLDHANTLKDSQQLFINFPNTSKTQEEIKWGQDFPVIVQRMRATFDAINLSKYEKRIAVAHDWGCFYFYLYDKTFPGHFHDLISLDVPAYSQINGIVAKLMVIVYQWILIFAFLIGRLPGRLLCKGISKFFKYTPKYFDELSGARCYPYFYLWKNMIQGIFDRRKMFLYHYTPSVPVVYVYGKKKPFQFAGDKWNNYLMEHDRCESHGMDCGHWIMNKYNVFLVDLIARRLKALRV